MGVPSSDHAILVREERAGEAVEYVITADGDEVRFSYWSRDRRDYRPHAVSRYRGAKKGLVSDAQILAAGYSTSELAILRANAQKEAGGTYGAINTWDNQIVSCCWPSSRVTLAPSPICSSICAKSPDRGGVRAVVSQPGSTSMTASTRSAARPCRGVHVVVRDVAAVHRGDRGWEYLRSQPRLIGAFLLAGNDPAIQLGQIMFWRRAFLTRAYRKVIGRTRGGGRVSDFLTAERSIAIVVRLYNWMPAYVVKWCDRLLDELAVEHPGRAGPRSAHLGSGARGHPGGADLRGAQGQQKGRLRRLRPRTGPGPQQLHTRLGRRFSEARRLSGDPERLAGSRYAGASGVRRTRSVAYRKGCSPRSVSSSACSSSSSPQNVKAPSGGVRSPGPTTPVLNACKLRGHSQCQGSTL